MREILFRGKDIINGKWITGSLVDGKHIGCWVEANPVRPETVGQFTELTDKNGVKIFEGDIVVYDNTPYNAYGHRVVGVMVWHKWMWKFRYKEYESTYHYSCGSEDFFGGKSEVIGNIHDNPELLENITHQSQ